MTDAPAVRSEASSSALSGAQVGPGGPMNVLAAARAAAELAAYVGVCPTCLAWEDPEASAPEGEPTPGRPVCPTCGRCSVEWDLAQQIHEQVDEMRGVLTLDEAVMNELGIDEAFTTETDTDEASEHPDDPDDPHGTDPAGGPTGSPRPGSPSQVPRRDA